TFFADDGRLFFAIPMGRRTVIGTTDTRMPSPHSEVTPEDRQFVLDNINKRLLLERPLTVADVISERCGVRPLVVQGAGEGSEGVDWTKLSRKHELELDEKRRFVSIFGGKLTDCVNVGDEVCALLRQAGVALRYPRYRWYGEPPAKVRSQFYHQARLMGLDALAAPYAAESLSDRLWRRYGRAAFDMLEDIRRDPKMGEVLIETSEYLRCELWHTAEREMVVTLDDFLRRRSKIALVVERERLLQSEGLKAACRIFFGNEAEARWREYFPEAGEATPFDHAA
ncbi:MAG: FAD-dependent oxidoreductase, partial [Myxococcales bacterium]|nr:FAD-dependent oxidoreductase [Myxococcales bacterium]